MLFRRQNGTFGFCDYISFPKSSSQVPILRSIQYVTFKYGDFQKASRISLRELSTSIKSIIRTDARTQQSLLVAQKLEFHNLFLHDQGLKLIKNVFV